MNDYKELIKNIKGDAAFRHILSECGDDGRVWFDKRFICDYVSCLKHAIEQLVRERDADEKQIPKRPTQNVFNAWCPNCKEALGKKFAEIALTTRFNKYCPNCGQALDWSEEA